MIVSMHRWPYIFVMEVVMGTDGQIFVYSDGDYKPIQIPGADLYLQGGINNRGDITGAYATGASNPVGFLLLH